MLMVKVMIAHMQLGLMNVLRHSSYGDAPGLCAVTYMYGNM